MTLALSGTPDSCLILFKFLSVHLRLVGIDKSTHFTSSFSDEEVLGKYSCLISFLIGSLEEVDLFSTFV